MTTENANLYLSNMNGKEFNELLRTTYLEGVEKVYKKEKAEDMRRKTIVLNAILDAARAGKTSTRVLLNSSLSKNNENFLRSANIDWEFNLTLDGVFADSVEYTFYWENLKDELAFDEED